MSDNLLIDYRAPSQAARDLGVSAQLVRAWCSDGRMASVKTPLGRLVPIAEVERMRAKRESDRPEPQTAA